MAGLSDYTSRDWHLDVRPGEGKRILSLDGGGVRGLVTLGILQRIEETLAPRFPGKCEDFRLSHYFDLIVGTSTGAIIATALALGMRVNDIKILYEKMCPEIFSRRADTSWYEYVVPEGTISSIYDEKKIENALKDIAKDRQLQSAELQTGLMLCAKRMDTGSPWILTNNPKAPYWIKGRNNEYELWRLIRASTAAPLYFEPVTVVISPKDGVYDGETGVFVDGAVAGLNNPSFQAFLAATLKPYGFHWPSGRDNVFMVSVGSGWWRNRQDRQKFMALRNWEKAKEAISGMIQDTSLNAITTLQGMSNPKKPWYINSEILDLDGHLCRDEEMLSFQRYDATIDEAAVKRVFPEGTVDLGPLRDIGSTDPEVLRRLYALGHAVGRVTRPGTDGIEPADFPDIFDPPGFGP